MEHTLTSVTENVKCGKFQIKFVSSGKSKVWNVFGIVVDNEDNDIEFAACKKCNQALSYKGRDSGTTALSRHKCAKEPSNQPSLTSLLKPVAKPISLDTKSHITDAVVDMIAMDLVPFEVTSGRGFKHLLQKVKTNS